MRLLAGLAVALGAASPPSPVGREAAAYTAKEAQAIFAEANDAYYRQDFGAAKDKLQRLAAAGLGGPDVLFNLGTMHLAAGELGPAVLNLERARRLSAADDIEANLAVAKQRQLDQVVGAHNDTPFLQRVADAANPWLISVGFVAAWYAAFGLLLAFRRAQGGRGLLLALLAVLSFSVAGGFGATIGVQAWVRHTVVEAVMMDHTSQVREFPKDSARVSFEVHAGLKVRVMERSDQFARIRLPNALEGWTEASALTEL